MKNKQLPYRWYDLKSFIVILQFSTCKNDINENNFRNQIICFPLTGIFLGRGICYYDKYIFS